MLKNRLKELRFQKSYTQKKIAELLGISQTTYNSYETRGSEFSFSLLIEISKIYNVTTDYLLGISDVQQIEKDSTMISVTYKEQALLKVYRQSDDFGKAQIFGYAKAIAKGTEQNFNDITKLQNRDED